jgi:F0F1-type ATP synthase membrane subunit b/b'
VEQWLVWGLSGALLLLLMIVIWLAVALSKAKRPTDSKAKQVYADTAEKDVQHIFNDTFRQELRNRGLLHFEQIINENAMFLQQDLRLTASQVNDYMKQEIKRTLTEEFSKYEQSIADAKQLAIDSINKTQTAIEQQRDVLTKQLEQQFEAAKGQLVSHFEENMADIVNHYIMTAIGDQIDLNDQLEYIIGDLEANKTAIVEDINHGA